MPGHHCLKVAVMTSSLDHQCPGCQQAGAQDALCLTTTNQWVLKKHWVLWHVCHSEAGLTGRVSGASLAEGRSHAEVPECANGRYRLCTYSQLRWIWWASAPPPTTNKMYPVQVIGMLWHRMSRTGSHIVLHHLGWYTGSETEGHSGLCQ